MFVSINGEQMYLWRAVDSEGEVLEILVQKRRDKQAARKLLRKLLKRQSYAPTSVVTDKLRSYGAALCELGMAGNHDKNENIACEGCTNPSPTCSSNPENKSATAEDEIGSASAH